MARRSARLASISKMPKPTDRSSSLLASVAEREDSPEPAATKSINQLVSSPAPAPKTPGGSSPVKPPLSEMHPSKVHHTMNPPSSGLRLGFTDIRPAANRDSKLPAAVQSTPTKIGLPRDSDFTFRSARHLSSDLKLGPEAQRMMEELRGEASKIKAELAAKREAEKIEEDDVNSRKIAAAKGKSGRFSAAHIAEFKKMDSIANHPSVYRAQQGNVTPLKPGIKRTQSKANLHDTTPLKQGIKRSQSKANIDEPESARAKQPATTSSIAKPTVRAVGQPTSPVKRARQHIDDDASSNRPVSRDGSGLPVPKSSGVATGIPRSNSSLAALMTPTKSSMARSGIVKTPGQDTLAKTPLKSAASGIPRSATTSNLPTTKPESTMFSLPPSVEMRTPSRFDRVKSMLRGTRTSTVKVKTGLPLPRTFTSKTPAPPRSIKDIPAAPLTTPRRKLTKRVAFSPDTQDSAAAQHSPSPLKSSLKGSKARPVLGEVYYPPLDAVLAEEMLDRGLAYPDLSGHRTLPEPPAKESSKGVSVGIGAPGTFTFRSDHTISFGNASPSFGSSPGQSSVRPVRPSILPTENMPGSFPASVINTTSPNKENEAPMPIFPAVPHGMKNKKRHRVSSDEEEAEQQAADRAAKKRKQETVPEGDALLAPRLMASGKKTTLSSPRKLMSPGFSTASGAAGTPSPKKRAMISLSRLNMLARPKARK